MTTQFYQKSLSQKVEIDLRPETIFYCYKDGSKQYIEKEIPLGSIRNSWSKRSNFSMSIHAFSAGLASVNLFMAIYIGKDILGLLVCFVMTFLFGFVAMSTLKQIIEIETDQGNITLLSKEGTLIRDKIIQHRNTYYLNRFGNIDWNNDPAYEIRKFEWLKSLGVIDDDEFQNQIERLKST